MSAISSGAAPSSSLLLCPKKAPRRFVATLIGLGAVALVGQVVKCVLIIDQTTQVSIPPSFASCQPSVVGTSFFGFTISRKRSLGHPLPRAPR
jgi:hypothetical protein